MEVRRYHVPECNLVETLDWVQVQILETGDRIFCRLLTVQASEATRQVIC